MTDRPRQLRALAVADDPGAWRTAGFAVDGEGRVRLGATTLLLGGTGRGVTGWALDGVAAAVDGIAVPDGFEVPPATTGPVGAHPNGITAIDHVVVATDDATRTVGALEAAGLELRRTRELGGGATQSFLWAGDVILEVVSPPPGGAGPGGTRGTAGAWIWGLSLVAPDLDATAAVLGDLLGAPRPAVQAGRRIATLRTREAGISLPIAVMSPHHSTFS
ncbi:MAG: glyoxalase [Microthrixaceae bacterium]